jgi:hypothetical protein
MATTIKSTALDFESIKNNLKVFFQAKSEFADYNFEASGLSNLLDVLAYNTHYNALIANFALNESYLSTAQLRSSLVSLAEGIGYIPKSRTSSRAVVNLSINTGDLAGRPASLSLPAGTTFTSTIGDTTYTYQTNEVVTATEEGGGFYEFKNLAGSSDIYIYEGIFKSKTFFVGSDAANVVYIIPDKNLDLETVVIKIYETATSTSYTTYNSLVKATIINENSTLYILKEASNGYYELAFSDGTTLGKTPLAGNKIVVEYLSVSGPDANKAQVFQASARVTVTDSNTYNLNVNTIVDSMGGAEKEELESIRKNAPFQYASQNRMVTAVDYSSLVLRNFPSIIKDIKSWGGEDALNPKYGTIFMSIVFNDDVTLAEQLIVKQQVLDLSEQLSVISFDLEFDDPITTWIESGVFFQFNPRLTSQSVNSTRDQIASVVSEYFTENTGKFERAFRRSNMLTLIDEVSPAVLSSRADIKMQQRIVPLLDNTNDFALRYPAPIAIPDDDQYTVVSSPFNYNGRICNIRNRLSSTTLEIIALSDLAVVVDNIGSYNPATGTLNLVAFEPNEILGGFNYLKISVVPANQSAIAPLRNDIIIHDADASFITPVTVSALY